ncbi:MAG: hypothetical protein GXO75_16690 [Calditrichaeota bacterium]|nr:hypothetical protein [Calditrichota bacterium]
MKQLYKNLKIHSLWLGKLGGLLFFLSLIYSSEVYAQPLSGSLLDSTSVIINGEQWTFRTPPPPVSERQVISTHPRLLLTQANLPGIREKLTDSVYADDMNTLRAKADNGGAIENALLYQLEEDISRGNVAKDYLLAGNFGNVSGLDKGGKWLEPVFIFDWIFTMLTDSEKADIYVEIKKNFDYDHLSVDPRDWSLYWAKSWGNDRGFYYPLLALAIVGSGVDDAWADEVLDLAYNESPLVFGPYGATKGAGFLDMLASISLDDGGGYQAGSDGFLGENYYHYFLYAFMPLGAWETATGQPMWSRTDFFRKLPSHWEYQRGKTPRNLGIAMPEILTGAYKDIDPDAAALARWQVNKWGRSQYVLTYRLILGDLRVIPKSPQELGMPTAKYIKGSDLFVSTRSWDENALTVTALSQYLDTGRFEPGSGLFAIYRGNEPLAVPSDPNKEWITEGFYSGMWIYDPSDIGGTRFNNITYQNGQRAYDAYTAVSDPVYFPGGPDNIIINNTYRGISTEYSSSLKAPGVRISRQTIVHILDPDRDFIVVYNYTDIPDNLRRAWSMRLAVTPSINGNGYSIPGMQTTIVAPVNHTFDWVGGSGNEFRSPSPQNVWYGNDKAGNKAGYSATSPDKVKRHGLGNLFVKPTDDSPDQLEFLVVMEASSLAPVPVARISDREVRFGDWQVTFASDGTFTVVNTGAFPPDTTAPDAPTWR